MVPSAVFNLFSIERVDASGQIVVPRCATRALLAASQAAVERGIRLPWFNSGNAVRAYWASRTEAEDTNRPSEYLGKDIAVVDFMVDFWGDVVPRSASVLEVGSNAGANLARLSALGFTDVRGIELNPHAIAAMPAAFPHLDGRVTAGALEDVLSTLAGMSVDLVFSMAVLLHVHPESRSVFADISRIAARAICIIECETAMNSYVFPRNYRRVFERLGWKELRASHITPATMPDPGRGYDGYTARLFVRA